MRPDDSHSSAIQDLVQEEVDCQVDRIRQVEQGAPQFERYLMVFVRHDKTCMISKHTSCYESIVSKF